MRAFGWRDVGPAIRWAACGGQSLHLHRFAGPSAPGVFRDAIGRGESIAHLFDWDLPRLHTTMRRLYVRFVKIDRRDAVSRHADLVGKPLRNAAECSSGEPVGCAETRETAIARTLRLLCHKAPAKHPFPRGAAWAWWPDRAGPPAAAPHHEGRDCDPRLPGPLVEWMLADAGHAAAGVPGLFDGGETPPAVFRTQKAAEDAAGRAAAAAIDRGDPRAGEPFGEWWPGWNPRAAEWYDGMSEDWFACRVRKVFGRDPTPGEVRIAFG